MRIDAEPGSPSELAPGWVEQQDAVSGRRYWLHLPTDRISYRRPRRPLPSEPVQESSTLALQSSLAGLAGPSAIRNADVTTPDSTSYRPPADPASPFPGIPHALSASRPLSMQTRVDSSSSLSSTSSGALRSPPPPYESTPPSAVPARPRPLSTIPLASATSSGPSTSDDDWRAARYTVQHLDNLSNSQQPDTVPAYGRSESRPLTTTPSSPGSLTQPVSSFNIARVPSTTPQSTAGATVNPVPSVSMPQAPILSLATTPSSSHVNTPVWSPSSASRLPPLPPVPPQLRLGMRREPPARSASAQNATTMSNVSVQAPARSHSDPIDLSTRSHATRRSPFSHNNDSLVTPLAMSAPARERSRNSATHVASPTPMSPSARSDHSVISGTTVVIDSDSDESHSQRCSAAESPAARGATSNNWPNNIPSWAMQTAFAPPPPATNSLANSPLPIERARRPYAVAVPPVSSPVVLRPRPIAPWAGGLGRTRRRNSATFPSPRNTARTGLTPDIEELSSFSSSPGHPPRTGRSSGINPSTPFPDECPSSDDGSAFGVSEPDDIEHTARAIRNAMPNPARPSTPTPRSRSNGSTPSELEAAENYARDLESRLSSTSSREQILLNEIWKIKLEKAKRKIDELQEKLVDLGRRDARLERELEQEKRELHDWDIARLDESIMQDLGKLSEAEYARLKRELDREMTIDELRERLHSYEPLHYDYDPFDPEGKYLLGSHKARRNRRSMSRPDSPGFDAYSYNNGCLGRTASQYGARDFGCPKYPSRPESYAEQHSSTFGGLPSSDSCSCITMYGDIFCRKPYTHRLQNTISKYHRPLDSVFFDDDHESATIPLMNEYSGSGYSSEDDRMFSTPSISSSPLLSRRRSTSALQPRPILRRGNSYTRPLPKPRGRRVSFEDEQNLGDEGESMFITAPGFPHSPRYF